MAMPQFTTISSDMPAFSVGWQYQLVQLAAEAQLTVHLAVSVPEPAFTFSAMLERACIIIRANRHVMVQMNLIRHASNF